MSVPDVDNWIATISKLKGLHPKALRTLEHFYDKRRGFQSGRKGGPWTLSHALCVKASFTAPAKSSLTFTSKDAREKQLDTFYSAAWSTTGDSEDVYTVSVALPSFTKLVNFLGKRKDDFPVQASQAFDVMEKKVKSLSRESQHTPADHAMFLYWLRRAFLCIQEDWIETLARQRGENAVEFGKNVEGLILRLGDFMKTRLYYFVSMCSAISDNEEDALQLGYLVHSLDRFDKFSNDVIIDHGIRIAVSTLFKTDRSPRIQTILRDEHGTQNISASPIELLSLLSHSRTTRSKFLEFEGAYRSAFDWLCATQRNHPVDPIDPVWMVEPWRGVGKPEAWINAHIVEFLCSYLTLLRGACDAELKAQFGASISEPDILWPDLSDSGGWKRELEEDFIRPLKDKQAKPLSKCSILLYGPPGTAKTSIARAIAWELEWPFIAISPHQFAEDGLEGVIRRARELFERLLILDRCVVLFDELDELVTRREGEYEKIGRFITTSMLPWFQDLHDRGEIVFIATTNVIRDFDPAVKRPGRFDFVLPCGAPTKSDRERLFVDCLKRQDYEDDLVVKLTRALSDEVNKRTVKGEKTTEGERPWAATIGEVKTIVNLLARRLRHDDTIETDDEPRKVEDRGEEPAIAVL